MEKITHSNPMEKTSCCEVCGKVFSDKPTLSLHVRRNHKGRVFYCFHCGWSTKFKHCVRRHISSQHGKKNGKRKAVSAECYMCGNKFRSRGNMIQHYGDKHDVDVRGRHLEFETFRDFEKWKEGIEQSDVCRYFSRSSRNGVHYYRCFRDGLFRTKGKGRRHLKIGGSVKINNVCPASIKAQEGKTTGKVEVVYVHSHVGHIQEIGRLHLTKKERAAIAQKLAANASYYAIVDSIGESLKNGEVRRFHLTTRKDIWNIQNSFAIKRVPVCEADERNESLERWVKLMQEESDVVQFYKPQSIVLSQHAFLKKDDFVLIIASHAQIEMLNKFGSNIVCFNTYDGLNTDDFKLTALVVLDNMRRGFPCAYMLSNRRDSEIVELFASVLKPLLTAPVKAEVLMCDISDIYLRGWSKVMPKPKHLLYGTWYVDLAWRMHLSTIRRVQKRRRVYSDLNALMTETDEASFVIDLEDTVDTFYDDRATSEFGTYFQSTFLNNTKSWAHCYRSDTVINANAPLMSFHKVLKYIFLDGKRTKQLDKTISSLMRLTRDKLFDQSIFSSRDKSLSKLFATRVRHQYSASTNCAIVPCGEGWLIRLESEEDVHLVSKTNYQNCSCNLKCAECNICIHKFKCDCIDSVIKSNICKHIHCVALFIVREEKRDQTTDLNSNDEAAHGTESSTIEDVIVAELSKNDEGLSGCDVKRKNTKLRVMVEDIIENVRCDDHAEILFNALLPVEASSSQQAG